MTSKRESHSGTRVIFAADVNSIKSYVFDTDSLPIIRGGSRQLSQLNTPEFITNRLFQSETLKQYNLDQGNLLFAGGGSLLAILPNEQCAHILEAELTKAYRGVTGSVRISVAYRAFSEAQINHGLAHHDDTRAIEQAWPAAVARHRAAGGRDFGEIVNVLSILLQHKKQKLTPWFTDAPPFAAICPTCQIRPAEQRLKIGGDTFLLCSSCSARQKLGRGDERYYWIRRLATDLRRVEYPLPDDLSEFQYPQDLSTLAANDDIALIYADGDDIGLRLKHCQTTLEYKTLSTNLQSWTQQAVAAALKSHPSLAPAIREIDGKRETMYPWEVITIGGDDVLIIVPAAAALQFAVTLADQFYTLSGQTVTMSVGFVIAKTTTPIRVLRDTAEAALKSAKRLARDTSVPCIDYHDIVHEGTAWPNFRRMRDANLSGEANVALTGRPYSLADAQRLNTAVNQMRSHRFPKSQVYALVNEMKRSDVRGSLFYSYQWNRMSNRHQSTLDGIQGLWDETNEWPWLRRHDGKLYTIFDDVSQLL